MSDAPHVLIVEARFYEDIADELARGAIAALAHQKSSLELIYEVFEWFGVIPTGLNIDNSSRSLYFQPGLLCLVMFRFSTT